MSLLKTGLRYLLRRPLQSILCIIGVALGVAVVIAIDLANVSAARAFNLSTETVAGRATHQVIGSGATISDTVYRRIKVELGIDNAAPIVSAYATAVELDQQPLRILGIDAFADFPFRNYLGDGNVAASGRINLSSFLVQPNSVLISQNTAERYGLKTGSTFTLRIGARNQTVRVVGILQPADANSRRALDGLALMDIAAAQQLFQMPGQLSHIDLIADERTAEGRDTLARIAQILPPGMQIVKPQARSQSVESLTDAFQLNLTALSLLALVVGMFLIYNTIMFSVVQRRPMIGTLRCLGVTQGEIFRLILTETLILAAIGGLLGVGLGILMGRGSVRLVTQTINDLYYVVNVQDIEIAPFTLIKGFVLGVGAALLAALAPAYEATSIPPVTALKRSNVEQRVRRVLPKVAVAGVILFAIGGGMLLLTKQLVVNLGGIFGVIVGLAIISPLATVFLMEALTPLMNRFAGVIGRMSTRSVVNSISRTAIAIASLMIAVSVIIGLQSMIGSFRNTVENWLEASLLADIYVGPVTSGVNDNVATIDAPTIAQFKALPGVAEVTLLRRAPVDAAVGSVQPVDKVDKVDQVLQVQLTNNLTNVTNLQNFQNLPNPFFPASMLVIDSVRERPAKTFVWSARDTDGAWAAMKGRDELWVSEPFANKHDITQSNNRLVLRTDQGEREFIVQAVYYDYASDQGIVMMRRDTYERYFNDRQVSSIALYLSDPNAVSVQALRTQFAGKNLLINANRDLRNNALQIFDRTFAITGALNLLATVVAFIGVLSALMALQIERTRELGMLRANGMTLRQLWRMTLLETGLMGGTAGLFSMPTGWLLALILVYIINLRSFGWTIRLNLEWQTFAQALLVALISALLAGIYPMLRLGKIAIASAVRQE